MPCGRRSGLSFRFAEQVCPYKGMGEQSNKYSEEWKRGNVGRREKVEGGGGRVGEVGRVGKSGSSTFELWNV
jgi:hypothetical protein